MTMTSTFHPDDDRLSALAGADRDATSDRALVEHVSACDRCGPIVDELRLLRSALAGLPDIPPSRPLQLLPPVAEPQTRRARGWLQRLVAPAIATGAGLVLVGAVGSAGLFGQISLFAAAGAAPPAELASSAGTDSGASYGPGLGPKNGSADPVARNSPEAGGQLDNNGTPAAQDLGEGQPWSLVLLGGFGFIGGGLLMRRATGDRAANDRDA
jgi:hypothetical protein